MRRIFYLSGNRLKAFEWHNRQLLGAVEFKADTQGLSDFADFLRAAHKMPAQLLVDLVEEDFRRETIPHVNSRDRKALIQRLLDRHYRDEDHHQVRLLQRSNSGRKDDHILMSALSNFEQLRPWLSAIDECRTPLAGIWSVPLIIEDILSQIDSDSLNLLIVSRELAFYQRETFFKDKQLMFSRLEKLDHDLVETRDIKLSTQNLTHSTDQIRHFLTNQRIIGFTEPLKVYCLIPDSQLEISQQQQISTDLINYQFVGLNSLFNKLKLQNCTNQGTDALFAYLCSKKSLFTDHYGRRNQKHAFYRHVIANSIDVASVFGAMLLITVAALLYLDSRELKQLQTAAEQGRRILEHRYQKEFGDITQPLGDAGKLRTIVEHTGKLQLESRQTPQQFFTPLSSVLSQAQFSAINIDEYLWSKYPRKKITGIVRESTGRRTDDGEYAEEEDQQYESELGSEQTTLLQPVLKIIGNLNRDDRNYRDTVSTMRDFFVSLEALPQVSEIHILRTPVDVRPEARFTDKSGTEQINSASLERTDVYEVLLVLEPLSDAGNI